MQVQVERIDNSGIAKSKYKRERIETCPVGRSRNNWIDSINDYLKEEGKENGARQE